MKIAVIGAACGIGLAGCPLDRLRRGEIGGRLDRPVFWGGEALPPVGSKEPA